MFAFWANCASQLFLLDCPKCLIRNDGFMRVGVEIPIHEAIVFDFGTVYADSLLEQHPPRVLLVGQQFVEGFPIPPGFAHGGRNALLLQPSGNFTQAISAEISDKNPTDNSGFIWIDDQFSVQAGFVSVALALGHLGGAITKASLKSSPDGLAFSISFIEIAPFTK